MHRPIARARLLRNTMVNLLSLQQRLGVRWLPRRDLAFARLNIRARRRRSRAKNCRVTHATLDRDASCELRQRA
eukprot:6182668-Pleurochrysis_carterae.AAC.2